MLVIENTSIYHRRLWSFCNNKNIPILIGNATHIKWSFGIARGKNDTIDSMRLCQYAFKESDTLKDTPVPDPELIQLKDLMTSRTKLLSQINSIKTYIKELQNVNDKAAVQQLLKKAHKEAIEDIARSIKNIEIQIKKIIAENRAIKSNYDLLITVPGIGHLTAVNLICCTCNFAGKISGKQLACYAGVPFEYKSGISIKGKNRVHKMAKKDLKKLLNMGALSAIQYYPEFRTYYDRKIPQ